MTTCAAPMPTVATQMGAIYVSATLDSLEMAVSAWVKQSILGGILARFLLNSLADVNECELDPSVCGPRLCVNTEGSYECTCPTGYVWNETVCNGTFLSRGFKQVNLS